MIKKIRNCFETDPINMGRQRELDIAKGFIIIFMSLSHAIEILGWFFDPQVAEDFFWHGFDMIIKGSAPVFMFSMGITLSYSKKQSPKDICRRAWRLVGIVTLLELARTVIPSLIEWLIFREEAGLGYADEVVCVDILQFAIMAFWGIALMKKLKLGIVSMLAIAAVFSVIGQLLQGVSTGSVIIDRATGFLWNSNDTSFFPFLNWFIVPVIGYAFGKLWIRLKDKDTFFKLVTPVSILITVAYYAAMVLVGEWYFFSGGDYCGIGLADVAFMFVIFFVVVGGCYYFGKWFPRASNLFVSMGLRLNSIYCIHWTIYGFLYLLLVCITGGNYVPLWTVPPVALVVLVASDLLSRLYKSFTKKKQA